MRAAVIFCGVALSIIITTRCQRPHTCFTPLEWSGEFSRRDVKNRFNDRGRIDYGGKGQRISFRGRINDESDVHDILLFPTEERPEGARYFTRYHDGDYECAAYKLEEKFRPFGIPENATFIDQYFIGSSAEEGDGVEVAEWGGKTEDSEYIGVVTAKDCVPINNFFFNYDMGDGIFTSFFNIVLGFDPDAFVVPSLCPNPAKYKY